MGWRKSKKQKRADQGVGFLVLVASHAAGIDVGATEIFVAVPPDRDPSPVRSFAFQPLHIYRTAIYKNEHRKRRPEARSNPWNIPLLALHHVHSVPVRLRRRFHEFQSAL
jgi:hypothetical protein